MRPALGVLALVMVVACDPGTRLQKLQEEEKMAGALYRLTNISLQQIGAERAANRTRRGTVANQKLEDSLVAAQQAERRAVDSLRVEYELAQRRLNKFMGGR